METEFKLPELGENVESGTVAKILVARGEELKEEQPILELETDKAVIEVPSDTRGVIREVLVREGDQVKVGQAILVLEKATEEEVAVGPQAKKKKRGKEHEGPKGEQKERELVRREGVERGDGQKKVKKETALPKEAPRWASGDLVELSLPELGENIEAGTVARVLVSVGEPVEKDQGLLELETDKAVVEVPSSASGVIAEIFVQEGEQVKVGQKFISLRAKEGAVLQAEGKVAPGLEQEKEVETEAKRELRAERPSEPEIRESIEKPPEEVPTSAPGEERKGPREIVPAAPLVRRFAREIGIEINEVSGTGPGGRISIEDVKNHARKIHKERAASPVPLRGVEPEPLPDFSRWGEVERKPMSSVRRKIALHLSYAWTAIPHVTQFDRADVTELERLRKEFAKEAEAAGGKLTITAILVKIVAAGLKVFPQFNASIDMARSEIIFKKYYNIGVAVDTERGLLVPVIRGVDRKNIIEVAAELTQVAEKARGGKLSLEEMQGGNFSISNLGGIGGTAFTPLINSPEVAILGISRSHMEPVYREGQFEPRLMLPLSLSYDHRIIDGADAARFLRWLAQAIEQPFLIVLEG